jgi:protein-S-isoprenylcysteine O-methyltransferase Ste14
MTEKQDEGLVIEIREKENLEKDDIIKELKKGDVSFVTKYDRKMVVLISLAVFIWLLPFLATCTGWTSLSSLVNVPRMTFPPVVNALAAILLVASLILEAKVTSLRSRLGGVDAHESLIVVREGPYAVMRHPGYLSEIIYFSVLPVVLSPWIPFTATAFIYILVVISIPVYLIRVEDSFNVRKWGDEYREYMDEVPAINFFKGLRERRKADQ